MEPIRRASVSLRVRTKLKDVSLIYAIPMRKLARALTGKDNLAGLYAWCAKEGVGVDGFQLSLIPGGSQGSVWLDARRENGVILDRIGNVVATVSRGQWSGDASWRTWLDVLPSTAPPEWGTVPSTAPSKPAAPAPKVAPAARAPKGTALTARVDLELTSRAQLERLDPLLRRQLEVASKELCGKKGLAALTKWCDAEGQGLAHVVVTRGKTKQFEAWLTAPLEDGVFFDAGEAKLSGLAISQADVHASLTRREPEVAALRAAMKTLRAPRAPTWKG